MKYLSVVFVAATTLLSTVSAIPAPSSGQVQTVDKPKFTAPISTSYKSHLGDRQSGGNFNAVEERQLDPEIVCARAFAEWRYCKEAAGCDRECPAGEACYQALCATPASTTGNACTQLRAKCGLLEGHSGDSDEHGTVETDKRQVLDDPNAELGAHLIDLWTDPNYAGSFTFAVYSQMITRSCVDYSNLPQTWASFRIYPQNILFYCTFYAKANCAAGGKAFTISDGTNGYAIPDLAAFGGGLWNHNIRSLKCQPGTTGGTSSS
ncbi:hypothetical protein SLS60_000223 [Paraconiothyrium brasiliense]|uniref:Uncharacterized protein n=1 Tax=Paraconiothyrium brasiliense TaxID=300254 RepID=A0ABR3S5P9_9PLEO